MNVAGVASDADAVAGEGVPLEQARDTFTAAPLFGTKSFDTVNVALFCVFVIVHDAAPPMLIGTLAHADSLIV